jgi:hypothetical protein
MESSLLIWLGIVTVVSVLVSTFSLRQEARVKARPEKGKEAQLRN